MRALGLDVGDARIGLATGDPTGLLATPRGYIERTGLRQDAGRVLECARENGADRIVVGMPISLDGKIGPQARRVATFVETLRRLTDLPIVTVDERYTTAEAERLLRLAGRKPSRNKGGTDAASAAVILQEYLDTSRRSARP